MKKNLLYLGLTGYLLFALCTRLQAQTDSLQAHRYVTRATMYGVGFTNVFDTYLSPQEYKGIDFRISRETIRMTKLFDGNVSVQNFFQADVGYTHNRADNNNTFSGLVNWNYGLHYQFRLTENFKLLAGGLFDVNGGFVYNLRNSNNPASARANVTVALAFTAASRTSPVSVWIPEGMSTARTGTPLAQIASTALRYSPASERDTPIPKMASMITVYSRKSGKIQ